MGHTSVVRWWKGYYLAVHILAVRIQAVQVVGTFWCDRNEMKTKDVVSETQMTKNERNLNRKKTRTKSESTIRLSENDWRKVIASAWERIYWERMIREGKRHNIRTEESKFPHNELSLNDQRNINDQEQEIHLCSSSNFFHSAIRASTDRLGWILPSRLRIATVFESTSSWPTTKIKLYCACYKKQKSSRWTHTHTHTHTQSHNHTLSHQLEKTQNEKCLLQEKRLRLNLGFENFFREFLVTNVQINIESGIPQTLVNLLGIWDEGLGYWTNDCLSRWNPKRPVSKEVKFKEK
jgi:hypothetical protein